MWRSVFNLYDIIKQFKRITFIVFNFNLMQSNSFSLLTSKKLPNVYKSCQKMSSLEKLKILTPLQKLPKIVGDLGKLIVATGFEKLPKSNKSPNLVTLVTY